MRRVTKKSARSKRKRTRADYVRLAIWGLVIGGFICTLISQQLHLSSIHRETEQCKKQIALQEEEHEKLSKKAEFNASDEFYEQKARDEGYVSSNETVFVIGN